MSIITKRGDQGTTDLMFGKKIAKYAPQVEAYGAVDELNAALGLVRAELHRSQQPIELNHIDWLQESLVGLMGELATLPQDLPRYYQKNYARVTQSHIDKLESIAYQTENDCQTKFTDWAKPGVAGCESAARLELARTICRRAERRIAQLQCESDADYQLLLIFTNRLSDFLWLLARKQVAESQSTPHAES